MSLKNKKILITGATGGIGNHLVEKFDNLGSDILATGTNEEKLKSLKAKFPRVAIESFKLDEHDKIEHFIETIDKKLGISRLQEIFIIYLCTLTKLQLLQ